MHILLDMTSLNLLVLQNLKKVKNNQIDLIMMYRIITGKDDVPHDIWFKKMSELDNTGVSNRTVTGTLNVLPPGKTKGEIRQNLFSNKAAEQVEQTP